MIVGMTCFGNIASTVEEEYSSVRFVGSPSTTKSSITEAINEASFFSPCDMCPEQSVIVTAAGEMLAHIARTLIRGILATMAQSLSQARPKTFASLSMVT
jgi:hypothetical protein